MRSDTENSRGQDTTKSTERGFISKPNCQVRLPFGALASSDPSGVLGLFRWTERAESGRVWGGEGVTSRSGLAARSRLWVVLAVVGFCSFGVHLMVFGGGGSGSWVEVSFSGLFHTVQALGWFVLVAHVIGFFRLRASSEPRPDGSPLESQTAVLMPVYHEDVSDVEPRIRAMLESFVEAELNLNVSFFLLSDSTDSAVRAGESAMISRVAGDYPEVRVGLRRRRERVDYKAGNIAAFLDAAGDSFEYFLVLDADSLVTGCRLKRMIQRLQREPQVGILQASVLPVGGRGLFTRVWQYSLWRTTPLFCAGLEWVMGGCSVYWGHNALIRLEPFRRHARLPVLPGKAPLGGRILSQDIVEAALLGRAGYEVAWDIEPGGSYDEIPPDVVSYGARDHRWCQGNLQHGWLVGGEGIRLMHRLYFVYGILTYVMSGLILLLLSLGLWEVFQTPAVEEERWIPWLLLGCMPVLQLVPKSLGFLFWFRVDGRPVWRQVMAGIADGVLSSLLYPLLMFLHVRALVSIGLGRATGWGQQRRSHGEGLGWDEALACFWLPTLIAVTVLGVCGVWRPTFLAYSWILLGGWLFSIPLAVWSASGSVGDRWSHWFPLPVPSADRSWLRPFGLSEARGATDTVRSYRALKQV